ncbi:putative uncharacterized protein [Roseburia sp. CAG:471]|nr:putative uncharacterized protein [Roseburia sp. CAG:471]
MAFLDLEKSRFCLAAFFRSVWTSRRKFAAFRHIFRVRNISRNRLRFFSGISQSRNRSQQSLRIRVGRIGENCFYISPLYHAATVHNGNIIADLCNNAKIMCNKQDRCTRLFFQLVHQIQYLCLNRYIQCGRRLIRDQDFRLTYKCHGNHDPLSLAAGKLERILLHHMLHTRNARFPEHVLCLFQCLFF